MDEPIKILENLFTKSKLKANVKSCKKENSFLIFDISLKDGGTYRQLENRAVEMALALKALSVPLIYPITNEGIIRAEIMIEKQRPVPFEDISNSSDFLKSDAKLPLILGKLRKGDSLMADLAEMPHLLIGGATGSGKSVMLQCIINSLLISKKRLLLALIDPKRVEFSYYHGLNNLFGPIAKDSESALELLRALVKEMERRFIKLEKAGARNIDEYERKMPYIVVIIDELADLMMSSRKETQELICALAQKSRACGIHLIVATQRPSAAIITGSIKANFPAKISCKVSESVNSRIILDRNGAENLVGKGDAIIDCLEHNFKRFKGALIEESTIISNVNGQERWWRKLWT